MTLDESHDRRPAAIGRDEPHPQREYRRAMRDFTQLTRHRLANPLTALSAGISALRELDDQLEDDVRATLIESLQHTATQLELAVLHPELARDGDGDGTLPNLDEAELADLLVADAVEAEQHARTINEQLFSQVATSPEQTVDFLCECWALECDQQVTLPMADYFIVHARHDQFVIAPNHDLPAVEHVVERHDDWWVVRKTPSAMKTALDERLRHRHASPGQPSPNV